MPVKPKSMRRSLVVEYDPRRAARQRAGLLVLLLAVLAIGYLAGYQSSDRTPDPIDPDAQLSPEQRQGLNQRLIDAETASAIDREALEALRQELADQRGELAELTEAVGFYRKLMAPDEVDQPVSVGAFELTPNSIDRHYHYRIVVQQTARKHSQLRGNLTVNIDALRGEEMISIPLSEWSAELDSEKIPLQFKYFQSIEGNIEVPEDLLPTAVRLSVAITRPKAMRVKTEVPWQIEG